MNQLICSEYLRLQFRIFVLGTSFLIAGISTGVGQVNPMTTLINGDFGTAATQTGAAVLGATGDVWNTLNGSSNTIFDSSNNVVSGVRLTLVNASQLYTDTGGTAMDANTTALMEDYAFGYNNPSYTATVTVSLTGLTKYTNSAFNLVVYAAGDQNGQGATLNLTTGATGGNTVGTLTTSATSRQISAGLGVAYNAFMGILTNGTLSFTATESPGQIFTIVNGFQLLLSPFIIATQPVSQTNSGGNLVSLNIGVIASSPLSYQWQAGAVGSGIYTNLTDSGQISGSVSNVLTISGLSTNWALAYQVIVANGFNSITSAVATLTVLPSVPPTVTGVFNVGTTNVEIVFSKPVTIASATNVANYAFANGLAITNASLGADNMTVTLTTVPLAYGSNYVIVINNILDLAIPPDNIATNTLAGFTVSPYASQDIGAPVIPSSFTLTTNGVNVSSAGNDIGGTNDQFNFQYQSQNGNFDVTVCLAGLGLSDLWAQAGLMARASLAAGSPFAATLATPGMNGEFFAGRTTTNGVATASGNFPVNYPNTWLRLNRVGNVFTGFGSYDGINWATRGGDAGDAEPDLPRLGHRQP